MLDRRAGIALSFLVALCGAVAAGCGGGKSGGSPRNDAGPESGGPGGGGGRGGAAGGAGSGGAGGSSDAAAMSDAAGPDGEDATPPDSSGDPETGGGGEAGGADGPTGTDGPAAEAAPGDAASGTAMSFFITSRTGSANLGGIAGADKICTDLATAAGSTGKTWLAYLGATASGGTPAVHPRDRIGSGPWYNSKGVKIGDSVAQLHQTANPAPMLNGNTALDEKGMTVPFAAPNNQHDILTGATPDGMASRTCVNWTSEADGGGNDGPNRATVGHHNRMGGGAMPTSWNSAHNSQGCSASALRGSGGAGRFYCFATN